MSFMENAKVLEIEFKDGTIKLISLEGLEVDKKRQWRDWASKLMVSDTFIIGWAIS
jgi:hypothetical protein